MKHSPYLAIKCRSVSEVLAGVPQRVTLFDEAPPRNICRVPGCDTKLLTSMEKDWRLCRGCRLERA